MLFNIKVPNITNIQQHPNNITNPQNIQFNSLYFKPTVGLNRLHGMINIYLVKLYKDID